MKSGQRIRWHYRQHLNNKSSLMRIKVGEFIGFVRHIQNGPRTYYGPQLAFVKFDGNKNYSKVPFDEIEDEIDFKAENKKR